MHLRSGMLGKVELSKADFCSNITLLLGGVCMH